MGGGFVEVVHCACDELERVVGGGVEGELGSLLVGALTTKQGAVAFWASHCFVFRFTGSMGSPLIPSVVISGSVAWLAG